MTIIILITTIIIIIIIDWSSFGEDNRNSDIFLAFIRFPLDFVTNLRTWRKPWWLSAVKYYIAFVANCFAPVNLSGETNVISPVFVITPSSSSCSSSSSFILMVLCARAVWGARGPSCAPCTCLALARRTSPGRVQEILGALHVLQSCCYFGLQKSKKRGRGSRPPPPPLLFFFLSGGGGGGAGGGLQKKKNPLN